jgi:hypothetical protein
MPVKTGTLILVLKYLAEIKVSITNKFTCFTCLSENLYSVSHWLVNSDISNFCTFQVSSLIKISEQYLICVCVCMFVCMYVCIYVCM